MFFLFSLYVQEHSIPVNNFNDDMGLVDDEDGQLFRRSGIIAAFNSLEHAEKFVQILFENKKNTL